MHFQLYFPLKLRDAAGALRAAGLADLASGCQETVTGVSLDPQETNPPKGLLVTWSGLAGWIPSRQRWIDCGEYWLGLWTDSPCVPEDLARQSLFTGYSVTLGDGQAWRVPLASELPATVRLVDRNWTKVRKPAFDEFWRASEVWYRRFMLYDLDPAQIQTAEGTDAGTLLTEMAAFAVFALRQNYRVTPDLLSELGVFDSSNLLQIVMAVVDGMDIKAVLAEMSYNADVESATAEKKVSNTPGC